MSPRRWTIEQAPGIGWCFPEIGEAVPVREDIITTEDVEAVAKHLTEIDRGAAVMEYASGYKDEARALLALVLGSGKEGEDER